MKADLVVKNGVLVTSEAELPGLGVAARDGKVVAIARDDDLPDASEVVDAGGKHILPGVIDGHVHFREPGFEYKEDFGTGSLAAVMGGVTCVIDMPNTNPHTGTPEVVQLKQRLAEEKSYCDFGILGLLVQENLDQLLPMRDVGVCGYKCFLGETVGAIPAPDDGKLVDAMRIIASGGLRVGFHAENNPIMQNLIRQLKEAGRTDARAHLESRPALAEVEAIQRVGLFGLYTGCKVHIFHLSSKEGMETIAEWKAKGVDITTETGGHYCFLSLDEYERQGSVVRMNPPVRGLEHGDALLEGLNNGKVTMIATDHSPHTPEEKLNDDIWKAISGFVGVETVVQIFLSEAVNKGRMTLPQFVKVTSENAARTWDLYPQKGSLQIGADADLTIVDLDKEWEIDSSKLHSRNRVTPFNGWRGTGQALTTIVRGRVVMQGGEVIGAPAGKMVRPAAEA
jgi:allantoinase